MPAAASDTDLVSKLRDAHARLRAEIGKVIVGQEQVLDQLLMAIFCRSHALLMGVPGLAKTLMVSTLSQALDMSFKRIQFTPDLMPSDITGSRKSFRTTRSTQAADVQVFTRSDFRQHRFGGRNQPDPTENAGGVVGSDAGTARRPIGGEDHPMRNPFFVLATQNPIEQEGTYPLPEAQLDRFLFLIKVDYPTDFAEEELIMRAGTSDKTARVSARS